MANSRGSFKSKGPYVAYGVSRNCIGGFDTLAEAKKACSRDELSPCGKWKLHEDSFGVAYHAEGNGCAIYVGYDHPHVKHTREEIEKATARFRWRESLR